MTYKEFENKYLGKAIDYDGTAGVQCVDLADQYLKDCFGITGVWVSGARDLYNNFYSFPALVKAFDRIPNTPDLVVKEGDVVVWGGGSWGHVAIGTGIGDTKSFISIEQNTLGKHEATQKVKHYFNNSSGYDGCSPVLGVLRPKTRKDPKALDTEGFKKGDSGLGVYFLKRWLLSKGWKIDDNDIFGDGTARAVNGILGAAGHTQNGIAGKGFAKKFIK